jgi:ribonucleotide monophosphatase NagD (HAD superfamily)
MTDYARLRACRLFVLDMDGTLYLGDEVLPGAIDFVRALTASGRRYVYLTNNSSRAGADYVPRLRRLGFPCAAEDVFSSGMATALYLKERHPGARVCLVGNAALRRELEKLRRHRLGRGRRRGRRGLRHGADVREAGARGAPSAPGRPLPCLQPGPRLPDAER